MYGSHDGRGHRSRVRLVAGSATLGAMLLLAGCFSSSDGGSGDGGAEGGGAVEQRPKSVSPYWVDPEGNAAKQLKTYQSDGKDDKAELIKKIAEQPVADWPVRPDPRGQVERVTKAAEKADRSALLVVYNVPHRDCGQYSQGGAKNADEYRAWLDEIAKGIGDREATVVVEPDAIPHLLAEGCTPQKFHDERYQLLNEAVTKLKGLENTKVYLDAGNPDWVRDPGGLVEPLRRAGIDKADGFALNVSNFQSTKSNVAYGKKLSPMIGNKPFVVDTSRNGNGPVEGAGADEEAWCNPSGRALGETPTTKTGDKQVDAYLWIKRIGESDGECKGGPKAGQWWPKYALDLARNAKG
ncbi:glycoside hydrolase family 6 protein [Streptomyces iconiensis]|uniref:Glucanase n=1 Tax=Streptomyces iconiensis TaxID=1384038 RepID=A0ABT6ZW33_9ACTN|nr:glycoside hydrolase family 6 protein [Streptomyces iconiensis]MDJ1133278.1 glycoside hydrolase family 6 protein [Streptomyces iconiensis]